MENKFEAPKLNDKPKEQKKENVPVQLAEAYCENIEYLCTIFNAKNANTTSRNNMSIAANKIFIDGKSLREIFVNAERLYQNEETKGVAMKMVADFFLEFKKKVNELCLSAVVRIETAGGKVETKKWIEYTDKYSLIDNVDNLQDAQMSVNNFSKITSAVPAELDQYEKIFTVEGVKDAGEREAAKRKVRKTLDPEVVKTLEKINKLSKRVEIFEMELTSLESFKKTTANMLKVAMQYGCPFIEEVEKVGSQSVIKTTDKWKMIDDTFGSMANVQTALKDGKLDNLATKVKIPEQKDVSFKAVWRKAVEDRVQIFYLALYCINKKCKSAEVCVPKSSAVAKILNIAAAVCKKTDACEQAFETQYKFITNEIKRMANAPGGCAFLNGRAITPSGELLVQTFGKLETLKTELEQSTSPKEAYKNMYNLLTNEPNSQVFKDRLAAVTLAMYCITKTCQPPAECSKSALYKTAVLFCEKTQVCAGEPDEAVDQMRDLAPTNPDLALDDLTETLEKLAASR